MIEYGYRENLNICWPLSFMNFFQPGKLSAQFVLAMREKIQKAAFMHGSDYSNCDPVSLPNGACVPLLR